MAGKRVYAHRRTTIRGLANLTTGGTLHIGLGPTGFSHSEDRTYLNLRGRLYFRDGYAIGRGTRMDIGPGAEAVFGRGYVNANSLFVIMNGLTVGHDTVISWNCRFVDEDFHQISATTGAVDGSATTGAVDGSATTGAVARSSKDKRIVIGENVWVGCDSLLLKGVRIADGCVVAAGSVVTGQFDEPRTLIGGNPARVLKRDVSWTR